ncbi:MAG: AAA family ATPase [Lachnospiraceae bacterium]|nr:AAA family ATPase [Lachnospiraceae bacterium]
MKSIKIVVEYSSNFVLDYHQKNGITPIEKLKGNLNNMAGIGTPVVDSESFTVLQFHLEGSDENSLAAAKSNLEQLLQVLGINAGDVKCLVNLVESANEPSADAKSAEPANGSSDEDSKSLRFHLPEKDEDKGVHPIDGDGPYQEAAHEPPTKENAGPSFSDSTAKTEMGFSENDLLGATEFRKILAELEAIAPRIKTDEDQGIISFQNYIFSVNNGFGFTTYLNLLASKLEKLKLFRFEGRHGKVIEKELTYPNGEREEYQLNSDISDIVDLRGFRGIVGIDLSTWLGKDTTEQFRDMLLKLDKKQKDMIFVFRVPDIEEYVLQGFTESVNDIMYARPILIGNFSNEDALAYMKSRLKDLELDLDPEADDYAIRRINDEKHDGRFYGFHSLKKVVYEMAYHKLLTDRDENHRTITKIDIEPLLHEETCDDRTSTEMMNSMIGIEGVKEKIEEIVASIEMQKKMSEEKGDVATHSCIHMRFVGNPGTGKTTVARIIGRMLKEKGLLRIGNFYEVGRKDLCGRYVGETAPKTAAVCRNAYGSVLFIDEAYSLYRGNADRYDYGREAIDTLIAEMENHKDDMVVIMAGYPDDINTLMEANQGLEGRMPYLLEFPSYDTEELCQIFMKFVGDTPVSDDLVPAVRKFIESVDKERREAKEFSNGRFVRNLYDRIWAKAAMRCRIDGTKELILTATDVERATTEKEFADLMSEKKTASFGFN